MVKKEVPKVVPEYAKTCSNCKLPFNIQTNPHCRYEMWDVGKKKENED